MDPQPLVSILINNYNYAHFVTEAIESALAQTYRHVEIIVVDDGSTDDSREVIGRFGNLVRMVAKENGGQASAFNAGFAASKGEIICFSWLTKCGLLPKSLYSTRTLAGVSINCNCLMVSVVGSIPLRQAGNLVCWTRATIPLPADHPFSQRPPRAYHFGEIPWRRYYRCLR
jgi:hypothetical protein